ncbi:MAG: HIT family protein [Desulfuromonadaceae bacterium]|nr:HIT family protein [Desulfuromonadaceae bacterium]
MTETIFTLDERLQNDCHQLASWETSEILLLNNALVPWFVVVPRVQATELIDLPAPLRTRVDHEIAVVSHFIRYRFCPDKLNTAAIGNVVSQLHIHIIGRYRHDFCWPDVVWGRKEKQAYSPDQVNKNREQLKQFLLVQHEQNAPTTIQNSLF